MSTFRLFIIGALALLPAGLTALPAQQAFGQGFGLNNQSSPLTAQTTTAPRQRVQIELLADKTAVSPGDRVTVALRQTIFPGWHTYWINPGDSGEPTHIEWQLPAGAQAGPIQWPLPEAIPVGPLMNYGYSGEVLLLSDIQIPEGLTGPAVEITADTRWLVCADICVPESGIARLSLPLIEAGLSARPSPHAEMIAAAKNNIPKPTPWPAEFALGGADGNAVTIRLPGAAEKVPEGAEIYFFPLEWGELSHATPQTITTSGGDIILQTMRGDLPGDAAPVSLDGILAVQPGDGGKRRGYLISAAHSDVSIPAGETRLSQSAGSPAAISLWAAIGMAFVSGLILNLMPCVFPVLSLKAVSLAGSSGNAGLRRMKGLAYFGGVMASFALVGAALVAFRSSGAVIGWGIQFQSPVFVLLLMALFLGIALNLSGVFSFGSSLIGAGDSLTRRSGLSGDFFTGVLATIAATPCTAPFMGVALGYAFTQSAPVVFAVLLALGAGFALPILLLSQSPVLAKLLPKPGAWMETFKQIMAFPLYLTVVWLLWVLSIQLGSDGVILGGFVLVSIGFAAWLYGSAHGASRSRGGAAAAVALLSVGLGAWALDEAGPALSGRDGSTTDASIRAQYEISEPFSRARLNALRAQNKPVFINFTAAWCITCKVNERVALNSDAFARSLEKNGITYLLGDWTSGDPEITAMLADQGRVGVPLYLLFTGRAGEPPVVLPQVLTPSLIEEQFAQAGGAVNVTAQKPF